MDTDLALEPKASLTFKPPTKTIFSKFFCFLLFKGIFTSFFKESSGVFLFRPGTQGADSPPPFL
jgi:hypothetical protein